MLDSNAKAIVKNIVNQNILTLSATGYTPVSGINVQGYNTFYFNISGTFSTSSVSVNLRAQGTIIQGTAIKVFNAVTGVEVQNITSVGFYYVVVKGYDLLYFNTTSYAGNTLTIQYSITNADASNVSKIESYYERFISAYLNFTSASGYSAKIEVNGANTAIIHFQIIGGACSVIVERRNTKTWFYDRTATIYDSNLQPVSAITTTGLYYVDIKGVEVVYLLTNSNTGSISADVKTSLVSIPNPINLNKVTIFNSVSTNGYSSLITRSNRQRYIKLDIRSEGYDGVFNLIGRYTDTTDRRITLYNQKGYAVDDVKGEGIFYAEIGLWDRLYGLLISNTTGTIIVYAELLENMALPIIPQAGDNNYEKISLECTPHYFTYTFTRYHSSFVIHNKSKYCPVLIEFMKDNAVTTLTNPVRVEPSERMSIKVFDRNQVKYATVSGHADIDVYAGNIQLSTIPAVISPVQIEALSNRIVLDIKGAWGVFRDFTNLLTLYFSNDSGNSDLKSYTFNSGTSVEFAFITSQRTIIAYISNSGSNSIWYRLTNCFNSSDIIVTTIDNLNNPVDGKGYIVPPYSTLHGIDERGNILFGEYSVTNDVNNNNMRLLKSTDDGLTWTIIINMVRGYRSDSNSGVHATIVSVDVPNKRLVLTGDITTLCSIGQTGYVIDVTTGSLLTIADMAYDLGNNQTTITVNQSVNSGWLGNKFNGIRHFHSTKFNHIDKLWYITCGDLDNETIWICYDYSIITPMLLKQTGGSQNWRTTVMGFDSNGNVYHCCDGDHGNMGVIKTKLCDFTSENIFTAKSYIYCFDFNNNTMILGTTPTAYINDPLNQQTMHDTSEIYISKDMGISWQKVFHWKSRPDRPGGFVKLFGKDSKGRYFFESSNLIHNQISPENVTTTVITI